MLNRSISNQTSCNLINLFIIEIFIANLDDLPFVLRRLFYQPFLIFELCIASLKFTDRIDIILCEAPAIKTVMC